MKDEIPQHSELEAKRLITVREAATILGISQRTMYRLIDMGKAPAPVKLGRATRLVRTEVDKYIEQLIAERQRLRRMTIPRLN